MGHVLSAPAPALIHHPEPSSVSFRWRNPKQGELITAAPDFGQVASRPPDIHAGSGGSEFTTTGSLPPPPATEGSLLNVSALLPTPASGALSTRLQSFSGGNQSVRRWRELVVNVNVLVIQRQCKKCPKVMLFDISCFNITLVKIKVNSTWVKS